jgi:histidine kinase/DNA gyrase B/HSP90-like ATPase
VGETRVDLQHLLEDLRDAYAGPIEETILTEVIANALDASATAITLSIDPAAAALTVVDNGRGMRRRELARYHDIATSTKTRGEGIGFAGVGIKLGLLVSREVITETRRGTTHVATRWSLASRHRAPWKWIPPPGLVGERGTAVRLALANPLSSLLDGGFLEETVRLHFEPLLEPAFASLLDQHYPRGVQLTVGGVVVRSPHDLLLETVPIALRFARKRTASAVGYIARSPESLPEGRRGIAISTFGKVIKRGWEWLGISANHSDRITGLVEAPALAACLTLPKSDFIRTGTRGATYLAYRKALQEIISQQLTVWGDRDEEAPDAPRASKLDRDLERVLEDLATDFPLLDSLVARRRGGQKRLPMPGSDGRDGMHPLLSLVDGASPQTEVLSPVAPGSTGVEPRSPSEPKQGAGPEIAPAVLAAAAPDGGVVRRARYGLSLRFERRPGDQELGRLVENTIWVNEAHPAYERAQSSRSMGYHTALTVALALAPLAVAPAEEHLFVTRFLSEWGAVAGARRRTNRRSRVARRR